MKTEDTEGEGLDDRLERRDQKMLAYALNGDYRLNCVSSCTALIM